MHQLWKTFIFQVCWKNWYIAVGLDDPCRSLPNELSHPSHPILSYSSSFTVITKDIANWFLHRTNHIFSYQWVAIIVIYFPQSGSNAAYTCMQILCNIPEGGMALPFPSWILLKCWVSVKLSFAQCLKFWALCSALCKPSHNGPLRGWFTHNTQ